MNCQGKILYAMHEIIWIAAISPPFYFFLNGTEFDNEQTATTETEWIEGNTEYDYSETENTKCEKFKRMNWSCEGKAMGVRIMVWISNNS